MQKPNFYDEASTSSFESVRLGGHKACIKSVVETVSSKGNDMIVVSFDFDGDDQQPWYFTKMFSDDVREGKKWPRQGTQYINVYDYKDKSKVNSSFKSFCTSVEHSNTGFTVGWGADWGAQFVGKKVGVVFGLVESEYNGNVRSKPECRWFCSYEEAPAKEAPEFKPLKNSSAATQTHDYNTESVPF